MINNFRPFEEKYLNKKSIAIKDDIKVVISPTKRGGQNNEENSSNEVRNSTMAANEMAGIPKRKENFAASPLSQPNNRPVEIVIPDLETPGTMARA